MGRSEAAKKAFERKMATPEGRRQIIERAQKGGSVKAKKGFAVRRDLASKMGRKGMASRWGKKKNNQ